MLTQADCLRREEHIYMSVYGALRAVGTQGSKSRGGKDATEVVGGWGTLAVALRPPLRYTLYPCSSPSTFLLIVVLPRPPRALLSLGLFTTPQDSCSMP